jgi:hypothetical protein
VTGGSGEVAIFDPGYAGEEPQSVAESHGTEWVVVKLPEAKRGFVWVRALIREGAA